MNSHGILRVEKEKDVDKEKRKIEEYRDLESRVKDLVSKNELSTELLNLTSTLLSKNPEYYTIWNHRRRILQSRLSSGTESTTLVESDLLFLVPLLIQFPKCYWIWNYRLWLLLEAEKHLPTDQTIRLWREELGLVSKMLTRDERNFHGWDYRRHVVSQLQRLSSTSMVEAEFEYTSKKIRSALQNFSALHYRSKLIPLLLAERDASPAERRRMLERELDFMQGALIDPWNQSAWFYHQFLMTTLAPGCRPEGGIVLDLKGEERVRYYQQEIARVREMLEDFDDCKWIYQALLQYSQELNALRGSERQVSVDEMSAWIAELRRLDPMRGGKWDDWEEAVTD